MVGFCSLPHNYKKSLTISKYSFCDKESLLSLQIMVGIIGYVMSANIIIRIISTEIMLGSHSKCRRILLLLIVCRSCLKRGSLLSLQRPEKALVLEWHYLLAWVSVKIGLPAFRMLNLLRIIIRRSSLKRT